VTKWEKMRIGWMECLEKVIEEFPLADTVNSLEWMVRELKLMLRISEEKYRLEMKSILVEE